MLELLLATPIVGWALIARGRGQTAVAAGSLTMAAVLSAAGLAPVMDFMPFLEGGWGMHLLALVASYALGAAVAFRTSTRHGSLCAAVAGAALLLPLSGALFVESLHTVEEVLERVADPRDAAIIREGSRGETLRLLELGGGAAGAVALVLLTTRRRRRLETVLGFKRRSGIVTGPPA